MKEKRKKIEKSLDLVGGVKKNLRKVKAMALTIVVDAIETVSKGLKPKTRGIGNQRKGRDETDHSIAKIGKNTQMNPGDLLSLSLHTLN